MKLDNSFLTKYLLEGMIWRNSSTTPVIDIHNFTVSEDIVKVEYSLGFKKLDDDKIVYPYFKEINCQIQLDQLKSWLRCRNLNTLV